MTETIHPPAVVEARKRPRFRMRSEVHATFSGTPATVINVSAEGIALRHAKPIKVGSTGSIQIESEENTARVSFRGRVRWSHISKTASAAEGLVFDTGIQIEEVTDAVGGLLGRLIRAFGEIDTDSMQRKHEAAFQRLHKRSTPPPEPKPAPTITRDQILLITEANTKLQSSPELIQEWNDRAKASLAKREATEGSAPTMNRREVLAIWEYLGRKIDFEIIIAVLDAQNA